jgi:gliding motility-associated lipoprotein GldH
MDLKKTANIGLVFVLINMLSCTTQEGFTLHESVAKKGLSQRPVVFIIPPSALKGTSQNIFIRLRNNAEYKFSNIFLIATLKAGGKQVAQDTLEYAMAAPDGSWLGKGFTELKESKLWWKKGIKIPTEAPVQIEVSQAMRANGAAKGVFELKGIVSVGISIEDQ